MGTQIANASGLIVSLISLTLGVVGTTKQKVDVPREAVAVIMPTDGNTVRGTIVLTQQEDGVHLTGRIRGLSPGKHGFHIHQFGDLRAADGTSAGGHFNPDRSEHGSPEVEEHHAGDLGNIMADAEGTADVNVMANDLKLHFVIGRALVVHGGADDLKSQPAGDAGPRVGLGVIGFANAKSSQSFKRSK